MQTNKSWFVEKGRDKNKLDPVKKELVENLNDYQRIEEMEVTFDQDSEVLDDNLHQGMRIGKKGKPINDHR